MREFEAVGDAVGTRFKSARTVTEGVLAGEPVAKEADAVIVLEVDVVIEAEGTPELEAVLAGEPVAKEAEALTVLEVDVVTEEDDFVV